MAYTDPWLFDPVGHLQWLGQGGAELGGPGPTGPLPPLPQMPQIDPRGLHLMPPVTPPGMMPKASILDRLAARLFPTANYTGLLDPATQQGLQRQGLLSLGTSLLQQSGPSPYRVPLGAAIGNALQQSQVNFPQMAQQALQLQAYKSQQIEQQMVADVGARYPAKANETQSDTYHRMAAIATEIASIPGGAAIAEKMAPLIAAFKPSAEAGKPIELKGVIDTDLTSPTKTMKGTLLLDPVTRQKIGFYPDADTSGYHIEKNTETGAAYWVPNSPGGGKAMAIPGLNLGGRPGAGATQAALTSAEARAAAGRLLASQVSGQQVEEAHHANAVPSTMAAVIGGVTRKLAGEEAGAGVTQALRSSLTNQYQAAAGRWVDAYMQLVPKSRSASAELRHLVLRTYWGQEGDDPANVVAKATARRAATAALARAVASGTPPALPGFEPEAAPPP